MPAAHDCSACGASRRVEPAVDGAALNFAVLSKVVGGGKWIPRSALDPAFFAVAAALVATVAIPLGG